MRNFIFAGLAVAAISLTQSEQAEAGGIRLSFGLGSSGCYGGYGGSYYRPSSFGNSYYRQSYRPSSYYRRPTYHDTSHYDYHPTTIRRHGSHYHITPGHYDFHRTGHWHH